MSLHPWLFDDLKIKLDAIHAAPLEPADPEDSDSFQGSVRMACHVLDDLPRELESGVAGLSLHRAEPAIRAAIAQCRQANALDENLAIPGPGGIAMFALGHEDGMQGLATTRGSQRFVTLFHGSQAERHITVSAWKPVMDQAILDSVRPAVANSDTAALRSAARTLQAYSSAGDDYSLDTIMADAAESRSPWMSRVAWAQVRPYDRGEEPIDMVNASTPNYERWLEYAGVHRELVLAAPTLPGRTGWAGPTQYMVEDTLADDGGFHGPVCTQAMHDVRTEVLKAAMQATGRASAWTAWTVRARGYEWDHKMLAYGDTDRIVFAISGPDGTTVARSHRNIDLMCDIRETITVLHTNVDGTPLRVEFHGVYQPLAAVFEDEDSDEESDKVTSLASKYALYADAEANPPRHTRRELATMILAGTPLPQPLGGYDYVAGVLLPNTILNRDQVVHNALMGLAVDQDVMMRMGRGQIELGDNTGNCEQSDFREPGDEVSTRASYTG